MEKLELALVQFLGHRTGGGVRLYLTLLFDDGEEVGAVGGEAEEAVAAGGVERLVEWVRVSRFWAALASGA